MKIDARPLPHNVYIDRDMWEKVILNLLSNAFKFTLEGEIEVRVALSADGRHALIMVRDTGIGIPKDRFDRLFKVFSQVDVSTTRRYGGTGLGLAISKRLSELMGGRIWAESEPGKGSEFIVMLAAAVTAGQPATVSSER